MKADWDDVRHSRLWRYNLHYFDDLNAKDADARTGWHQALIERWIKENPPGIGTGWEPYPTSLRIVNWIKWELRASAHKAGILNELAFNSLSIQIRWLQKRLEMHLLGNHLLANAKALIFSGAFFYGLEGERWLKKGLTILEHQLNEQILADGGHFERSPMYHAIVLEDILDLINLAIVYPEYLPPTLYNRLCDIARRMLRWLGVMTHPDGKLSFFNDAAFGIAPKYNSLVEYAERLRVPVEKPSFLGIEALPESGYVRLQNARAVVICDLAPIGPDYLPGHAHADTLSFELSLDDQRVLVNGGTSTYEEGSERQRQRSTASHNTLMVDGCDSSEVWASFRVARRAQPFGISWNEEKGKLQLEGAHDGYCRLSGHVVHCRRWILQSSVLSIEDSVGGQFKRASSFWHIHPEIIVLNNELQLQEDIRVKITTNPSLDLRLNRSTWCPEFGRSIENIVVETPIRGQSLVTHFSWE